ncbi:hypothetical protein SAMN05421852_109120 [Thermoflavimicrobium dichotomicum]|uniref:Death on curing protein n=1 Tax=Thermoflavimicrobium dichotomicum TaxID=46223 RepID=A0A1I3RCY3_9BACL|nr:hypothetical protein SAMN05421852_109120 [Thermoflavimicrobium dichotomicum]
MKIKYLTLEQIFEIHYKVMATFGEGEDVGVMFKNVLLSAVIRPQSEYFGKNYSHPFGKRQCLLYKQLHKTIFSKMATKGLPLLLLTFYQWL